MVNVITEHMEIWTAAQSQKANGGRGRGKNSNGQNAHGIKKLRELILELAVRGKLVPQDPNDQPASVLLEKIAKEKARLIKEGKIKKQKPLPEISEEEKTFDLPEGWEWARLQDVSTYIQRGKGPKYADLGEVQVISQKCIQWSGFDLSLARFVDDDSLNAYQHERFLQCDDLLWNSTGTGTVGRVNVIKEVALNKLVADSHVTVIRPLQVSSYFLWCYIAAPGIQLRIAPEHEESLVSGTTKQVELNTRAVQPLLVLVPPLSEQHRIVAKVDELMALCDQLEQQQTDSNETHQTLVETLLAILTSAEDQKKFAKAWQRIANHFDTLFTTEQSIDHLKQIILQLAVMGKLVPQNPNDEPTSVLLEKIAEEKLRLIKEGKIKKQKTLPEIGEDEKPFELPEGWKWVRLGNYGRVLSGNSFKSGDFNTEGGDRVIKITNAGVGEFIETEDYLPAGFLKEYESYNVKNNDLILALTRPYISTGLKISRCPSSYHNSLLNQRVAAIKFFTDEDYVFLFLRSLFVLNLYKERFGSTGLQPNLKISDVTELILPIPPQSEQNRIVAKVDELMNLCDTLKARLIDAQTIQVQLADSMVERAVT